MSSTKYAKISKIVSPTSKINANSVAKIALLTSGSNVFLGEDTALNSSGVSSSSSSSIPGYPNVIEGPRARIQTDIQTGKAKNLPMCMSLWDYSRMYEIGNIPIMDFIGAYILFYVVNSMYFKRDFRYVIFVTIFSVILLNILFNKRVKISITASIILLLCAYVLYEIYRKNKIDK